MHAVSHDVHRRMSQIMLERPCTPSSRLASVGRRPMTFTEAVSSGFANYAVFSCRASRSEFWLWVLFALGGSILANIADAAIFVYHPGLSPLNSIFTLAALLPTFSLAARRLHDVDRSGWWLLLTPTGIGILMLLYWFGAEGTRGPNRFGADPVAAPALASNRVT